MVEKGPIGWIRAFALAMATFAPLWLGLPHAGAQAIRGNEAPPLIRGTIDDGMQNGGMQNGDANPDGAADVLSIANLPSSGGQNNNLPNYGKLMPRKKILPHQYGAQPVQPLPALVPYASAPRQQNRDLIATPTTASIPRIVPKKQPLPEANPYDPVGLRLRSFVLTPSIEGDVGYESNPLQVTNPGHGSWVLRTETGAKLQSDWSRHELDATLTGGYSDYLQTSAASAPDASLIVNGRLDATRDLTLDAQGRIVLGSQLTSTPGLLTGANLLARPQTYQTGGTIGATQKLGRFSLGLHGTADRYTFQNASAVGGGVINLSSQNYNDIGLRARVSYEMRPGILPYVEVGADVLRLDQPIDSAGLNHNSSGKFARVGTSFELSRLLTGDLAVGLAQRSFADPRISNSTSPTFDASIIWAATPLTNLTLKASSAVASTSVAGASTAQIQTVLVQVDHHLLPNLLLSGVGTWQNTNYRGTNLVTNLYSEGVKTDYNLTRSLVVRGSFTHQRLQSTTVGTNYTDNIMLLGLKLQR